jgi:hypothetical protein
MASVRAIMNCIGADTSGSASLLFRLFGFARGRVPPDPDTTVTAQVSLLQLIRDLQGQHIHINMIRVGFDTLADTGLNGPLDTAFQKLDYTTYRLRNIYRPQSLGVGRVLHWFITQDEANGRDDIGSTDEADELFAEWSVPNDALDMFVVLNIDGFLGWSPIEGSCDKTDDDDGSLGGHITRSFDGLSRTFAHEAGHFLGLEHNHGDDDCPSTTAGQNRLMAQTGCAISVRTSVNLTNSEGVDMRDHCAVKSGC